MSAPDPYASHGGSYAPAAWGAWWWSRGRDLDGREAPAAWWGEHGAWQVSTWQQTAQCTWSHSGGGSCGLAVWPSGEPQLLPSSEDLCHEVLPGRRQVSPEAMSLPPGRLRRKSAPPRVRQVLDHGTAASPRSGPAGGLGSLRAATHRRQRYCWRFQVGDCEPGPFCPRGLQHLHVPECEFYQSGTCKDGSMCPLRHDGKPAWHHGLPPPEPELAVGHIPVLRDEAVNALLGAVGGAAGLYVDGTFGRGGHSSEILRRLGPEGRLVAFDVDPTAVAVGRDLEGGDRRFRIIHAPFGSLAEAAAPGEPLSGVLLDIGFSSPQMDEGHRGWSCMRDGPLDLRMNPQSSMPAAEWLQRVTVRELAWVFRELGDEEDPLLAQRLAEAVLEQQRRSGAYTSTMQLGGAIRHVVRSTCATSTRFGDAKLPMRAITAFINQEIEQLLEAMLGSFRRLRAGGRLVVITFKPLEEAVVQRFLRLHEDAPERGLLSPAEACGSLGSMRLAELFPLLATEEPFALRRVQEPVYTSAREIARNRRSRSAALQVLEKVPRRAHPALAGNLLLRGQDAKRPAPERQRLHSLLAFPPRGATAAMATAPAAADAAAGPAGGCSHGPGRLQPIRAPALRPAPYVCTVGMVPRQ